MLIVLDVLLGLASMLQPGVSLALPQAQMLQIAFTEVRPCDSRWYDHGQQQKDGEAWSFEEAFTSVNSKGMVGGVQNPHCNCHLGIFFHI